MINATIFVLLAVFFSNSLEQTSSLCFLCTEELDVNDPLVIKNLTEALKDKSPEGPEKTEVMTLKTLDKVNITQMNDGVMYIYQFKALGTATSKIYNCVLIYAVQQWPFQKRRTSTIPIYYLCAELAEGIITSSRAKRNVQIIDVLNKKGLHYNFKISNF